ncbi:accessory Sec system protein Asp3 [Staphylococcus delphini]|uniref:accessory Sec system protein Asp3 n=1 Tax=Staphylococcus delphini TaxID=53344 RepID=UPI0021D16429|nr:accessory Sec system protein Asp3 [Staphylococcus delphini]UXS29353.1 accessory Sec system protein Asp3 [Staphylococcus delphini]
MPHKREVTILWRHTHQHTYQYGATIQFHPQGTYFKNQLMPSGLQIHAWTMTTHFDQEGRTPSLPILKRGHHYRLTFEVSATPAHSVYFVVTFYRKNDTEISQLMINEAQKDFEYPKEAYRYDIRMMNTACHHLMFRRIVLTELETHHENSTALNPYENIQQVNQIIQATRHPSRTF